MAQTDPPGNARRNGAARGGRTAERDEIEVGRKILIINLFSSLGSAFLFVFGVNALVHGNTGPAAVLLTGSALAISNFLYVRRTGHYPIGAGVVVGIVASLFVYLLVSGGIQNTGPLWCYVFAPLLLFAQGNKQGLITIAILYLFSIAVFFFPERFPFPTPDYGAVFEIRFLASFLAVTIMSAVYEYSRIGPTPSSSA